MHKYGTVDTDHWCHIILNFDSLIANINESRGKILTEFY